MPLYDRDYMREQPRREPSWLATWTPLRWIIAINIAVFIIQHVLDIGVEHIALSSNPADDLQLPMGGVSVKTLAAGKVWTLITYMFVHEGPMHLIGNLLLIGFVGTRVQALIGARQFTILYFLSGLVGAGIQMAVQTTVLHEPGRQIIGASACGMGLLMAYAAIMPDEVLSLMLYFIIPITARVWTFAMGLLGMDLALGISAMIWPSANEWWGQNAYFAHIGGAFTGWYLVRLLGFTGFPLANEHLMRRQMMKRQVRRQVARVRRERAAPEMDVEATERRRREDVVSKELPIMDNVNEILEKISRDGMGSLSEEERRTLEAASREIARKEGRSL